MYPNTLNRAMARWDINPQAWRTAVRISMTVNRKLVKNEQEKDIIQNKAGTQNAR